MLLKTINRIQQSEIQNHIDAKKVVIILGARQVGKTLLIKTIAKELQQSYLYFNADEPSVREIWKPANISTLLSQFGEKRLILLDEAQMLDNAGLTLKIIVDKELGYQFIITGSSALELANNTYESLTGRKWSFELYPLSVQEMVSHFNLLYVQQQLPNLLVYGSYPEVITNNDNPLPVLSNIMQSYLYKDILSLSGIRKPVVLEKLLKALAWQMGNEVSLNELSRLTGSDVKTVDSYIDLLEKTFIIFSLSSFSRNLRNELARKRKIYFYDNGIRNAVINNFSPLENRNDTGQLWENFLMSERMKYCHYHHLYANHYFWRTTAQQEIDYIEERNGEISAFEFKWAPDAKARFTKTFVQAYKPVETKVIHRENFWEWVTINK